MHKILTSRDLSVHGIFLGPFCLQPKTCAKKTLSFADLSLSWRLIFVRQDEAASIFFWSWRQKRWWFTVTSFVMLQVGNHLHPTIWSLNLVLPKIGHRHSYSCDASSLLNFLHAFKTTDPMALGSVAVCPAMNIYIYRPSMNIAENPFSSNIQIFPDNVWYGFQTSGSKYLNRGCLLWNKSAGCQLIVKGPQN